VSGAPPWWAEIQRQWVAGVCAPLDADGGFAATPDAWAALRSHLRAPAGPGVDARAAVYQTQYWARLFAAVHLALPTLTRAVGAAAVNGLTMRALTAAPPDDLLDDVPEQVIALALRELATSDATQLPSQALQLDRARRVALRGPRTAPWRMTDAERARLGQGVVRLAPTLSVVRADWDFDASPPRRLDATRHYAIVHTHNGVTLREVDPLFARLLAASRDAPFDAAAGRVRTGLSPALRDAFDTRIDSYIADAAASGYWCGLRDV